MLFQLWEWVAKGFIYLLSLITLAVIGWWINNKTSRFHRLLNQLPGPPSVPFLGRAMDFMGGYEKILEVAYIKWPRRYGGIFRFNIGSDFYVCLSSPQLIEPFLNSQKVIDKGVEYKDLVPWLGYGLLLSTGDKWRSRRRLLTPAFHFQILDSFVEVFNKQSRVLCRILDQEAHDDKAISIHPFITRCSLDIICEAAMGTQINAQIQDSEYVKAVYKFSQMLLNRWINPLLTNQTIFALTDDGKEYPKILNVLHTFTNNIIQKRREEIEQKRLASNEDEVSSGYSKRRRALLDMLLEATITGAAQLTHEDIREEIDTFMFEGHDTVSSSMSWFLYCMATNPKHQEKVHEELMSVFGDDLDRDCTQEDLPQLKYLECCIKESLRLYPSVPAYTRILKEDFQLGKHLLPAGCTVAFLAYGMHRNPTVFPNPLVFDPQRFTPENSAGRHPYAYIPFSAGPRNCIGQRFAMMEEKVVTSFLLRRFKFSVSPKSEKPIPSNQIVLKSVNGIHLIVSSR